MEDEKANDGNPDSLTLLFTSRELVLSKSEKAEVLDDSHDARFQPVNDPSETAVIETLYEEMDLTFLRLQVNPS